MTEEGAWVLWGEQALLASRVARASRAVGALWQKGTVGAGVKAALMVGSGASFRREAACTDEKVVGGNYCVRNHVVIGSTMHVVGSCIAMK
jgi:hypothetical protein